MNFVANKIESWPIDQLSEYEHNSKLHPAEQVVKIAASINEFGFINPILVDASGVIIAGHGRLLAARKLNLKAVPVIVLDHLTDMQRKALIIADNKLTESGWDMDKLSEELSELSDEGFDLDVIGFTDKEIEDVLHSSDYSEIFPDTNSNTTPNDQHDPANSSNIQETRHKPKICPKCGFEIIS